MQPVESVQICSPTKENPLLLPKPRRPDIVPPQLDVQDSLHRRQDLLVRSRGASLEVGHDGLCGVALRREVLL